MGGEKDKMKRWWQQYFLSFPNILNFILQDTRDLIHLQGGKTVTTNKKYVNKKINLHNS